MNLHGHSLVPGAASGELLYCSTALSFWGGVNPQTGQIIDRHHPLSGQSMAGRILAIPSGRGSCTGSTAMLELLLNGCPPAGLIFEQSEEILTLGVLVGKALFGRSLPVVVLDADFKKLATWSFASIAGSEVLLSDSLGPVPSAPSDSIAGSIYLSEYDRSVLKGDKGLAAKLALEIIISFAAVQGATSLIDVTRAHIDACIYTGPASLRFALKFLDMGARFVLPTTLNSISIDQRRWKELGVAPELASQAGALANTYTSMGAQPSFTCAPYTLEDAPTVGENIGWAESNAVVFANSVLGAQTQKYPDFIDVCVALTGRAPLAGCHLPEGRRPSMCIIVPELSSLLDDSFYPLLGYVIGKHAKHQIPLICGLETLKPSMADFKALSAAFGTSASAAMFHIRGITPEGGNFTDIEAKLPQIELYPRDTMDSWMDLNSAKDPSVGLISLGNPHFSTEEFKTLSSLCVNRKRNPAVEFIITTSRDTYQKANEAGYIESIETFGATIIMDTCWCMIEEPVIPVTAKNIMTNSAKYAHYAPGMVNRGVHFGSLAQCVNAACAGEVVKRFNAFIL